MGATNAIMASISRITSDYAQHFPQPTCRVAMSESLISGMTEIVDWSNIVTSIMIPMPFAVDLSIWGSI